MAMPIKEPRPPHASVNWESLRPNPGGAVVDITCPWCLQVRPERAAMIAYRVRSGTFTGSCYKDRLIRLPRRDRLDRPLHPAVDWDDTQLVVTARQRLTCIGVTCPACQTVRYVHPGSLAADMRRGTFTGECIACYVARLRKPESAASPGRGLNRSGYVTVTRAVIEPGDFSYFAAMRGTRNYVLEHRLIMARTIGRALLPSELVDHEDGDKTNNDPANLRIYLRGTSMPGATAGYGTFYHEWQVALARIAELESLLGEARAA